MLLRTRRLKRRGAVTVEMAAIAPVLVAIVAGFITSSRLVDTKSELSTAARLGARVAIMERSLLDPGKSVTDIVTSEVRAYLNAAGLPGDDVAIKIVEATDHTTPFDIENPDNNLRLFELRLELPWSTVSGVSADDWKLTAKVVFRNARSEFVQ